MLDISNLKIDFTNETGTSTAVNNISLEVRKGEVLAIVGESGSGKSVTALSILRLLPQPPAMYPSGKILFQPDEQTAIDLLKASKEEMMNIRGRRIAMIFQEPMTSLNPVFTCGDQIMEAIRFHEQVSFDAARARTISLLKKVRLPDPESLFNRYPHQLSGGQKQRVMIAMAMSCSPDLLICDEPTTALDVTVQKTILELIRDLQQEEKLGVIFITHDLGVVAEIADRVVVMYKGQIVETGPMKQVFQTPVHPYTKALLACRPLHFPKGKRLPVVADFLQQDVVPLVKTSPAKTVKNTPADPLIEVRQLKVWFPAKPTLFGKPKLFNTAVDDISFKIYEGETLGIVGESGCGKTTLGRSLLKLVTPDAGSILYKGTDIAALKGTALRHFRKNIQLVFQDPYSSLNPKMTIGTAIGEPLLVHGIVSGKTQRRNKAIELLEKVNLPGEYYDRYPHEFSGGQRQRIVIARALALNPSFLVCDESVSALDVSVQAQVLNLLNDLKKEFGLTIVFISHDLSVVRYISDRIMVMERGKIVEAGLADEVFYHPREEYTKKLIAAIPDLE